jgi:hypothetical protein
MKTGLDDGNRTSFSSSQVLVNALATGSDVFSWLVGRQTTEVPLTGLNPIGRVASTDRRRGVKRIAPVLRRILPLLFQILGLA